MRKVRDLVHYEKYRMWFGAEMGFIEFWALKGDSLRNVQELFYANMRVWVPEDMIERASDTAIDEGTGKR